LANAEWLRLGVMHRNTFLDAPRLLGPDLRLRADPRIFFAGQITGAEGYVEATACGTIAGIAAARERRGAPAVPVPADTALGAIVAHLQNTATADFQPANVTWTFFSPLADPPRDKKLRRTLLAQRALAHIDAFAAAVGVGTLAQA
jgi:methylenetetrahydrofolate--tRNA-(uracil-5-)-methyltransferase